MGSIEISIGKLPMTKVEPIHDDKTKIKLLSSHVNKSEQVT